MSFVKRSGELFSQQAESERELIDRARNAWPEVFWRDYTSGVIVMHWNSGMARSISTGSSPLPRPSQRFSDESLLHTFRIYTLLSLHISIIYMFYTFTHFPHSHTFHIHTLSAFTHFPHSHTFRIHTLSAFICVPHLYALRIYTHFSFTRVPRLHAFRI